MEQKILKHFTNLNFLVALRKFILIRHFTAMARFAWQFRAETFHLYIEFMTMLFTSVTYSGKAKHTSSQFSLTGGTRGGQGGAIAPLLGNLSPFVGELHR